MRRYVRLSIIVCVLLAIVGGAAIAAYHWADPVISE